MWPSCSTATPNGRTCAPETAQCGRLGSLNLAKSTAAIESSTAARIRRAVPEFFSVAVERHAAVAFALQAELPRRVVGNRAGGQGRGAALCIQAEDLPARRRKLHGLEAGLGEGMQFFFGRLSGLPLYQLNRLTRHVTSYLAFGNPECNIRGSA